MHQKQQKTLIYYSLSHRFFVHPQPSIQPASLHITKGILPPFLPSHNPIPFKRHPKPTERAVLSPSIAPPEPSPKPDPSYTTPQTDP